MLENGNQLATNKKPQAKASTLAQGSNGNINSNGNITTASNLDASRARYLKGLELYKEGKVSIASNGDFLVNGYHVDTTKGKCECPDYKARKEPCKHFYAAKAFQRHGKPNGVEQKSVSKEIDKQSVITKLALLNTATEILKSHNTPIEFEDVIELASRLEDWIRHAFERSERNSF